MINLNFFSLPEDLNSKNIKLSDSNVDLWTLDTQKFGNDEELQTCLSKQELERSNTFYFQKDKRNYVLTHTYLRCLLTYYTGKSPEELTFRIGEFGKPELIEFPSVKFNLSNSGTYILFAVTSYADVGVDVEHIRTIQNMDSIVASQFNAKENREYEALQSTAKLEFFFRIWTQKEAFLKVIGSGLSGETKEIEYSFLKKEKDIDFGVLTDSKIGIKCYGATFTPDPEYIATVALQQP